ncbi:MAG: exodeoxyribonuclease III [Planctomycetes bacterium]|nr:exodeoxyribonuclease III [Planctomycetota bacterium]MCB9889049.1 exodeoxyribonuclease III [Planctomycetota bacterium]
MKIVTWNVNSIRARLPRLLPWLEENEPEIVCLQETKVVDDLFPQEELEDAGYNVEKFGQKTYNGVAILSQYPIENVVKGLPDDEPSGDEREARVLGCQIEKFQILNVYVPNGHDIESDKYLFKLQWLKRLVRMLTEGYSVKDRLIVCGDFNVTFDDRDVYDPEEWRDKIHCSKPERRAMQNLIDLGLKDALRKFHTDRDIYTWWDFRTRGFQRNAGLRIDHMLMSAPALKACKSVEVDMTARDGQGPSDHAPVIATFR